MKIKTALNYMTVGDFLEFINDVGEYKIDFMEYYVENGTIYFEV